MALSGGLACYRIYRCADGAELAVAALEPHFWAALTAALDRPDLTAVQFDLARQDWAIGELTQLLAARSRDAWLDELADLDACVEPVGSVADAVAHPQIVARVMAPAIACAAGDVVGLGCPIRVGESTTPATRLPGPPALGEHDDVILGPLRGQELVT